MDRKIKVTITYTDDFDSDLKNTLLFSNIFLGLSFFVFFVFLIIRQHEVSTINHVTPHYLYSMMDSVSRFKLGLLLSKIFFVVAGVGYVTYFLKKMAWNK